MALLESYIFGRVFRMFLTALVPVLVIIWTTQVLQRINLVTDSGQSIGSFAMLATYVLPTIIPVVIPFALIIGVTQTLQTMNNDSESAVIDSAGTPRRFIYRPVMLLAALLCLTSFVTDNFVEPESRIGMRETIAATYSDLLSTVIEEKAFRRIDDGLYVQISERVQGRILKGLFVADSRDPHWEMLYYAKEGAVDEKGGTLIMKDGEIHRKAPGGTVSIVHFDSYSFDLSDLSATRGQARFRASDRTLGFLFHPDPKDPDVQARPGEYRAELHRRLTDWFFPVTFALAALSLAGGAHSHRERMVHPLIPALLFAFVFRWIAFFLANRIENPHASPMPLYLFVVIVTLLLAFGVYRATSQLRRSSPLHSLADSITQAVMRLRGPQPDKAGAAE